VDEKRTLKRRHLLFYLKIYDLNSNTFIGNVGDLTIDGLMVLTDKPIPLKKEMKIQIELPKSDEFKESRLNLRVKTLWRKPDINPDIISIGCQILEIIPENTLLINHLIRVLGFND